MTSASPVPVDPAVCVDVPTSSGQHVLLSQSNTKKPTKTRKASDVFGLGPGITKDDAVITGSRLPSAMQVLRCMMYHISNGSTQNVTKFQAAQTGYHKIVLFYGKANIPVETELYACNKIVKLLEENQKLREIPSKR